MKFLWQLKEDIKSNLLAVVLIVIELVFAIVCFSVCFDLSGSFITSVGFFAKNYNDNSVAVHLSEIDDSVIKEIKNNKSVKSVIAASFYAGTYNGQTTYVGSFTKNAFTDLDFSYNGEMIDPDKNYGDAIPCLVSNILSKAFEIGKTYNLNGTDFYVLGSLNDDNIYYMLGDMTSDAFFMCYDKNNILPASGLNKASTNNAFITAKDGISDIILSSSLDEISNIESKQLFDWRAKLSDDFDTMSGNLIIGFLVLLLSTVGFLANNILSFNQNQRSYTHQLIVGQKKSRITLLFATRLIICTIISSAVVLLLNNKISALLESEAMSCDDLIFSVVTCFILCLICIFAIGIKINRTDIVER